MMNTHCTADVARPFSLIAVLALALTGCLADEVEAPQTQTVQKETKARVSF